MIFLVFLLLGCSQPETKTSSASDALQAVLQEHWQNANQEQIFFRKDPDTFRMKGHLPDMSEQGRQRRAQFNQLMLDKLSKIDWKTLSAEDQLTYRLFQYERQAEAKFYRQPEHLFPMNYYAGYHTYFAGAPDNMSFLTEQDYRNYLISLADFPRYNQQHLESLTEAIERGYTHYCESFSQYHKTISKHAVELPDQSVLFAPFMDMPESFSSELKEELRDKGAEIIARDVLPEYAKLYVFFTEQYMPNCRQQAGIGSLEGGNEYYQYLIEYYTTTSMTAAEIHQLGLDEVARIRSEMQGIIEQLGFTGSFEDFVAFLRVDPRFYAKTAQELFEKASYLTRKMAGQLPKWFKTLPRIPFDIKSSPTGGAYYVASDGSGTTSGTYFLDTQDLRSQPLYNLEALTYHEAEPGHHFQSALAQEQSMPEFRKTLYHSAYGEGWGLYSESLGKEMGFYQDPYSDFGRLTYEAWRACRLVVDTGIHAMGWSRQQAIDYLAANTALTLPEVEGQIDRYISWPAQALSYKVGELKIQALKQQAKQRLQGQFDIREFHEQILKNGSLPLALLEELTLEWIAASQPES